MCENVHRCTFSRQLDVSNEHLCPKWNIEAFLMFGLSYLCCFRSEFEFALILVLAIVGSRWRLACRDSSFQGGWARWPTRKSYLIRDWHLALKLGHPAHQLGKLVRARSRASPFVYLDLDRCSDCTFNGTSRNRTVRFLLSELSPRRGSNFLSLCRLFFVRFGWI